MKKLRFLLLSVLALAAVSCGEKPVDPVDPKYGDLGIFFDIDNPEVAAGETVSIPFTVTGSEGATLNIEATCADSDFEVSCNYGASYTGTIKFTAPAICEAKDVKVTLKASDSHDRSVSKDITVKVKSSDPLSIKPESDIASFAIKPNGKFSMVFIAEGLSVAKITKAEVNANSGWTVSNSVDGDKVSALFVAGATVPTSLDIKVSITDDHNRKADYSKSLSVVPISDAEGVANSFIVKPGNSVTIQAVKGNSTEKLEFDNAVLVWQDAQSLIKTVSGNGAEGVVVVETNAKSGNAVVAARKGEKIVWSWLIWVTDYAPEKAPFVWKSSKTGTTYTFMDRDMGALSNEKYSNDALGLYYQWGRKDPFAASEGTMSNVQKKMYDINNTQIYMEVKERPTYGDHKTTNLQLSIENPLTFYTAPSSAWPVVDWLTDDAALQNNDLWGGVSGIKTIYDPCPEGWMVPPAGDPWGFRSEYSKTGKLTDDGKYDASYPWYIEYDDEYCIGFRYKAAGSDTEYWFPFSGHISGDKGLVEGVGGGSQLGTSTNNNTTVLIESFAWGNPASEFGLNRPYGSGIRCVKE